MTYFLVKRGRKHITFDLIQRRKVNHPCVKNELRVLGWVYPWAVATTQKAFDALILQDYKSIASN